ncbi:MAG: ABC transporter ATP-binding protein [Bacteroidota bacterium]|nr:ABC transporter ATP-binding protein [Bacteroidota bacterium]
MDILVAENISKYYSKHIALEDVSISIPKFSIFGLLGPNGAGKTTLIRIITQIIEADKGQIKVNGEKLSPSHIGMIGYLPEERGLYKKMKVGEQLIYLARLKGMSKSEALRRIKMWFEKFEIGSWWNKNIEDLSKGMQQKIQFIATVIHEPQLLILDEPFSGFDPINANLIKDEILLLKQQGSSIIFSTHRMESVEELCDHIALINKSRKILDGPTKSIKEAYKSNTFIIEHIGPYNPLNTNIALLDQVCHEENFYQSVVQLIDERSSNYLLSELINHTEVRSFKEKIPSINEIFIKEVNREVVYE